MTERWRLLQHFDQDAGRNMAVDEALLLSRSGGPVLRLYTFAPHALSLGYFQRFVDVPAASEATAVVRRMTGGGAIHHAHELTFSITADAEHPLYRGEVRTSYERVHGAIAVALGELGVEARLCGANPGNRAGRLDSDRAGTGMCFHASTPLDLVWAGRKGVGSAQRRTGGRVLHHGSIKVGHDPLETGVATLEETDAGVARVAETLLGTFRTAFDLELVPGELSAQEEEHAAERAGWFGSKDFLHRR